MPPALQQRWHPLCTPPQGVPLTPRFGQRQSLVLDQQTSAQTRQQSQAKSWLERQLKPAEVDGIDTKLKQWLSTIPIGNGEERGWDEDQVAEIAAFARSASGGGLEHASAEEIYRRYVEHQVEVAEREL